MSVNKNIKKEQENLDRNSYQFQIQIRLLDSVHLTFKHFIKIIILMKCLNVKRTESCRCERKNFVHVSLIF